MKGKECRVVAVERSLFLFNKVCGDDQPSSPNDAAKSHGCQGLCLIQIQVLSSGSFPSACLSLCSLTLWNFSMSSLFIELFDNDRGRVESLFLVGASDRGAACLGSYPREERGRVDA